MYGRHGPVKGPWGRVPRAAGTLEGFRGAMPASTDRRQLMGRIRPPQATRFENCRTARVNTTAP